MGKYRNLFALLLCASALFIACGGDKDDPKPPELEKPSTTEKVNKFINDMMSDVYLWNKHLPVIDYKNEPDSKKYFDKLLYKEEDKWSFITDDLEGLQNSFKGTGKTFGYSLTFGLFSDSGNVFAIVEYVYPNTPASKAGIKRGDIIVRINNKNITRDNYTDLLYKDNLNITMGKLINKQIGLGEEKNITAQQLTLDPVLFTKVIEHANQKIGYIFYTQYIADFNPSIDAALTEFKSENIDNLVLDLRYNPGGGVDAARHICSSLAPTNVVNNSSQLITFQWNENYQKYWQSKSRQDQLEVTFDNTVPVKLNLDDIYILTGKGSASASELTITGLRPYMNVTTVGDTTSGKYTASITLRPEDIYENEPNYYKDFKNWALQPIVIRYANSLGETNFKDGFVPNHLVEDELLPAKQLGDKTEPLLKKALELMTGTSVVAMKRAPVHYPKYKVLDRGFSKFDKNKEILHLDN